MSAIRYCIILSGNGVTWEMVLGDGWNMGYGK